MEQSTDSRVAAGSLTSKASLTKVDMRLLDYADGFDRNLECPICHCPFIEATRLSCDHTFCSQCLQSAFSSQSTDIKSCPSCRTLVAPLDDAPVPRFVTHMIDDLAVLCPHHDAGCALHMRRGDVESHVRFYCPFAHVPCPATDCPLTVKRKDFTDDCLHIVVDCDLCESHMLKLDLEDHLSGKCPQATKRCQSCNDDVAVRDLQDHQSSCPKAIIKCTASTIGCNTSASRAEIGVHEANCTLVALQPCLNRISTRADCHDVSMQSLRHRNKVLETTLEDVKATMDAPASVSPLTRATSLNPDAQDAPFDSATHHLLSLHESLRGELDRVAGSITDLDGRISMMVINENLRLKEEMTHMNAVMNSMRMQLQWLTSARLQHQSRAGPSIGPAGAQSSVGAVAAAASPVAPSVPNGPTRRLSDSSTKL